jgi:hypothetical protein
VKAVTNAHDSVFVWGDLPEVYYVSGRLPATRFVHTGFLTGNTGGRPNGSGTPNEGVPGAWAMLIQDMSHLPDLIVDTSPADIRQSDLYPLYDTPLWPTVRADYRLLEMVDGVRLYQLRSG